MKDVENCCRIMATIDTKVPSMQADSLCIPVAGIELNPEQALMCLQALSNYVLQLRRTKDVSPRLLQDAEAMELAMGNALIGEVEVDVD